MTATLTPRGHEIAVAIAKAIGELADYEREQPAEAEQIWAALVRHVRSVHPMALTGVAL